jgi:hypothetical protein
MNKQILHNGKKYDLRIYDIEDGLFLLDDESRTYIKNEELVPDDLQLIIDAFILECENTKYKELRKIEYDKLNQDELRYNDFVNGTNTWIEAIQQIKSKFPKPE